MLSAGLVPFRVVGDELQILIAHPGGPFWKGRQKGAWSIIKGVVDPGEEPLQSALREFSEETGWAVELIDPISLGDVTQRAGKRISAWAFAGDFDPDTLNGATVTTLWRGRPVTFPEIDEVRWCGGREAERLLNPAQAVFYERLALARRL
jgi:predicted NUDIX family NTP pyrophosphohydrolase